MPERFPAELVLRDLAEPGDAEATERILARYLVLRLTLGDPAAGDARTEREVAREYVAVLPANAERRALTRLLGLPDGAGPLSRAVAYRAAGDAAAEQGHRGGAFLLYREAFRVARGGREWREGSGAARSIARLARSIGAERVARLWSARARRQERAGAHRRVIIEPMSEAYTREQRGEIERAIRGGEAARCPACSEPLIERQVPPRQDVAYVRRRLWLVCPACRRTASVDVTAAGPP
jgi:hypothetical protein